MKCTKILLLKVLKLHWNNQASCSIVELRRRITDSDIPFFVDINMFDSLPESFKQEVLENYIVFYKK